MHPRALFLVLLGTLAFGLCPVSARVGETLDQCKKRYGKATPIPQIYNFGDEAKDLVYYNFAKNGIDIQIGFLKGTAADLSFRHHHVADPNASATTDPTSTTNPADVWTQVEIDTLLAANSGGMSWKATANGKMTFFPGTASVSNRYGPYEQRDDGVTSTVDGPTLHIFTPDWVDYIDTAMLAHEQKIINDQKKNLEGF